MNPWSIETIQEMIRQGVAQQVAELEAKRVKTYMRQ